MQIFYSINANSNKHITNLKYFPQLINVAWDMWLLTDMFDT